MLNLEFLITKCGLKNCSTPKPSQVSHAPAGLLNENVLGSSSWIEKPQTGHANLSENKYSESLFSISTTFVTPCARSRAVSRIQLAEEQYLA